MAIFWSNDFITSDKIPVKLEIMLGEKYIGDKMYFRVNGSKPVWFNMNEVPVDYISRQSIIEKGLDLIKDKFDGVTLYNREGKEYTWHEM